MIKNTKTINMKKLLAIIALMGLILIIGCNKSDDNLSDEEKIVGTWEGYWVVENNGERPMEQGIQVIEFKKNGTIVHTEHFEYVKVGNYTLDGDILKAYYQENNNTRTRHYRVVYLDSHELKLDLLDGRQWFFKRIK